MTRKGAKSLSLIRSEQWHVSPVKDKALDNIKFRTAVFVGSKIMSSATYHSTIFFKEKKGNCEYDAVRNFMVHVRAIQLNSSLNLRRRREGVLSTRVYPQWHIPSICPDEMRCSLEPPQ